MIFKILAFVLVIAVVYFVFFKKGPKKKSVTDSDEQEMIECSSCKLYISKDEAILSNAKYYCSKECLNK